MNNSYKLDFVLPAGPTGPSNVLDSTVFAEYNDIDSSGVLSIKNNLIFPNNSNVFRVANNYVYIDKFGYYEFTISGYLANSDDSNNISLILKTSMQNDAATNNLIIVRLDRGKNETYFSHTKVGKYGSVQKVSIILNKPQTSKAYVRKINLIIKKMPWSYIN